VKVFVEISAVAATAGRSELSQYVARLEDAGATGVTVSDHLFYTRDGLPRRSGVRPACDPLTTLASVAALSDRLELQTVVVNTAWIHPALLLRQFTQLAVLAGGERVTAGLGAGWSPEEFAAQGLQMPPFRQRMERLEEVLALARQLCTTPAGRTWRAPTSRQKTCRSPPSRTGLHGCSSAVGRTARCAWPGATPTSSTCTVTRDTERWPEPPWRRPAVVTSAAVR
jgi:alkanesulfonate monooxygenase SsuD/methylene tetrahydromethanopterin reductase-like flavin-dependent oxidoreductase (luciferase family)